MVKPATPVYAYQSYPKWIYHPTLPARLVADATAHMDAGPGWSEAPGGVASGADVTVPSAEPAATVLTAPPTEAQAADLETAALKHKREELAALEAEETAEKDRKEAAGLHAATVAEVLEKIKGATPAVLDRVVRLEAMNPKGARATILKAVDAALAHA